MTKKIVTDEQYGQVSRKAHELVLRVNNGSVDFQIAIDGLQHLIESREIILAQNKNHENWLSDILSRERASHLAFFGQEFDLSDFQATLEKYGRQQIARWQKLGLEPHYLPKATMAKDSVFPGWRVKPADWYYNQIANGNILREQNRALVADRLVALEGITVLLDTRLKPNYDNGRQMYQDDDFLGSIIANLRKQGKILKYEYGPQSSRFGVSADEWENHIKPVLASKLNLNPNQLRLERTIEANVIPQLYTHMPRKDDGNTNTWVWYEEYFEDRAGRLYGGNSDDGGLAFVDYDYADHHWDDWSVRSLAVL